MSGIRDIVGNIFGLPSHFLTYLKWRSVSYVVLAARALLVAIFVVSLASKVRSRTAYREFAGSVVALGAAPRRWSGPVAQGAVAAEAVTVALLLLPHTTTIGFATAAGLLAAFTVVIILAMRRANRVPCRCFGASSTPVGAPHVVRNLVLLAAAGTGLLAPSGQLPSPAGIVVAVTAAAVAALFVVRIDDVAALFGPGVEPGH
jgi:hypothetical protein